MIDNNELRGALSVIKKHVFIPLASADEGVFIGSTSASKANLPEFYPANLKQSLSVFLESTGKAKLKLELEPYVNLVLTAALEAGISTEINVNDLVNSAFFEIAEIAESLAIANRNNQLYFVTIDVPSADIIPENPVISLLKFKNVMRNKPTRKILNLQILSKKIYAELNERTERSESLNLRDCLNRWNSGHKSFGLFITIADKALEMLADGELKNIQLKTTAQQLISLNLMDKNVLLQRNIAV
jgi:hypothetical protein